MLNLKISKVRIFKKTGKKNFLLQTLVFLIICQYGISQKKVLLEDQTKTEAMTYHENTIYNSTYLKLGGVKRGATLFIEATDIAGAPATSASIRIKGYEGRGKGIHINDATYNHKWFIGDGYNYAGIGIGYSATGQAEYRDNAKFIVLPNGNVGIGNYNPSYKLQVSGSALLGDGTTGVPSAKQVMMRSNSENDGYGAFKHGGVGSTTGYFMSVDNASQKSWKGGIIFEKTASAGRGSIHFCNNDEASQEDVTLDDKVLTINGDKSANFHDAVDVAGRMEVADIIKTTEVQVQALPWPDYVFTPSYKLTPLSEVEEHISKHGHLENIPSQDQVAEEGIALGEMNAKLLEKIEELTLYLIEQDKKMERMEEKIIALENNQQ